MDCVVLLGNSDNKLSQQQWYEFVEKANEAIYNYYTVAVHFSGGPPTNARYQNYCWVFHIDEPDFETLESQLVELRKRYGQDSIAVIYGATQFI